MAFNAEAYEWTKDLKTALDALPNKRIDIDHKWEMYEGKHPRIWISKALNEMFETTLIDNLFDNWIELAVEAPLTRTRVLGWASKASTGEANTVNMGAATEIWDDNKMDLQQVDLYRHVRIAGEGFIFVWEDDDKESGISFTVVDPREVYYPVTARGDQPAFVARVWLDSEEDRWRATLYYEVDVVRLAGPVRTAASKEEPYPGVEAFEIDTDDPGGDHGFDYVPVIRYSKFKVRRSMIESIIPNQHRISKLTANKMVAAEFGAFKKMVILTQQNVDEDDLRVRPNRALILDPGSNQDGAAPTSIWESSQTELANFDNSIDKEVFKLFTKAYLPSHMMVNPGSVPSGDAIEADEGPYTEMILDSQDWLGASHKDLWDLLGIEAEPQWRNPVVRSDESEATVVKTYIDAGLPLPKALEKYAGWTAEELKKLTADLEAKKEEDLKKQQMAIEQMKANSQGDDPNAQSQPGQPKPPIPPAIGGKNPQDGKPSTGKPFGR